jgi:hypothetical protein
MAGSPCAIASRREKDNPDHHEGRARRPSGTDDRQWVPPLVERPEPHCHRLGVVDCEFAANLRSRSVGRRVRQLHAIADDDRVLPRGRMNCRPQLLVLSS